jgi:hypothetical protein
MDQVITGIAHRAAEKRRQSRRRGRMVSVHQSAQFVQRIALLQFIRADFAPLVDRDLPSLRLKNNGRRCAQEGVPAEFTPLDAFQQESAMAIVDFQQGRNRGFQVRQNFPVDRDQVGRFCLLSKLLERGTIGGLHHRKQIS